MTPAAKVGRVCEAKLHDELAAANQKTMEVMIKQLKAEKAAIEAANESLKVMADAANAAKVAAEVVAAAAASGSSSGGHGSVSTSVADTVAKAMNKTKKAKLHEECTFPRGMTSPECMAGVRSGCADQRA